MKLKDTYSLEEKLWPTKIAYSKAETLLSQQRSVLSRLWFFLWKSILNVRWKYWCWSWSSSTLATWSEELTHWKRPWCWEGLSAGGEGDDRGWDGWMASPTRWMWVWVNSGRWWWMDREAWRAEIHGVAKSRTRLSDWIELKVGAVMDFIFLSSKIATTVTAAMKLKDACSLEGKLWQI